MKKLFAVVLIVLVACFIAPATVFADFQTKVQREVQKEISAFFQRNGGYVDKKGVYQHGSRITIDNMDGLMLHLNQIFRDNWVVPNLEKPEKKIVPEPIPEAKKEVPVPKPESVPDEPKKEPVEPEPEK